jgi:gliding motility-associated-like protein
MKKNCTIFLLLLLCGVSFSQITFNVIKKDVKCNHQDYGELKIVVTSTNAPYSFLWSTSDTTSSIQNINEGVYSVVITDGSFNDTTVSFEVKLIVCEMAPEIVFTPNSDGINDSWFIMNSQYFSEAWFLVYNRLGQKVFEKKGLYEPWDGKDLYGVSLPVASYYYVIYHDQSDEGTIIKGCVSVIK